MAVAQRARSRSILEPEVERLCGTRAGDKLDQIAVSDPGRFRGLSQSLSQFEFAGSATSL